MYRLKEIQNALKSVVGWEQSYHPNLYLDHSICKSESGLYFQGAHPLVTLDNMRSIMPDDWDLQYPDWNPILSYEKGQCVRHNDIVWIAIRGGVGQEPTASDFNGDYSKDDYGNPYWKPYNVLSNYLERLTDNAINQVVQTFVQTKELNKKTRTLLERKTFFDGAGRIKATTPNQHKLVGMEIVPLRSMGVTMKIERIGLQMTGATGVVTLYLFHSSQSKPIRTFHLDFQAKNGGFQWFNLEDCYLPYMSERTNAGGSWYLCYNQDELPFGMEAINVSKDWSREPCGTCNIGSVETWRTLMKYMAISPFYYPINEGFEENPQLWDIQQNLYTNTFNYGINCEVSIGCDLSDFIISQRLQFANCIQKQVAATALRTLAMNPDVRVNRNQSNVTRMDILYELDGNTQGRKGGLGYDLEKAYEAIDISTEQIDRVCLSCNNHGVKYRAI